MSAPGQPVEGVPSIERPSGGRPKDLVPRVAILGGAGALGRRLSRRLFALRPDLHLVIAGRRKDPLEAEVAALNTAFGGRASAEVCDAADIRSVAALVKDATLLVTAAPVAEHMGTVAEACAAERCDVVDSHADPRAFTAWQTRRDDFEISGRKCIAQAGLHPGLAPPLLRYLAEGFEPGLRLMTAMAMYEHDLHPSSLLEIVDIMATAEMKMFKEGRWQSAGVYGPEIDFGSRFGRRRGFPIYMEELGELPAALSATELAAYVAGYNWFADLLVAPVVPLMHKIKPGWGRWSAAKTIAWSLRRFAPEQRDGCELVAEAKGTIDGRTMTRRGLVGADSTWDLTAACLVGCIAQLLDGTAARPGVFRMADVIQGAPLLRALADSGIEVQTSD